MVALLAATKMNTLLDVHEIAVAVRGRADGESVGGSHTVELFAEVVAQNS